MQFIHHELGQRQSGDLVEITLSGSAANVRLMDSLHFESYRNGREHTFQGGLVTRSPVRLQIPHAGTWYVAVDMQGLKGTVRSSARVFPAPLRETQALPTAADSATDFDVFICHAIEDKDAFVRPLALALEKGGLSVWHEECELKKGDSLSLKLDAGMARSRFGVVVLSRSFFDGEWESQELDDMAARVVSGEQLLLPVWYEIARKELIRYSPSLADNARRGTATHTVEEIAADICEVGSSRIREKASGFGISKGDWCPPGFRAGRWGLRC